MTIQVSLDRGELLVAVIDYLKKTQPAMMATREKVSINITAEGVIATCDPPRPHYDER